MRHILERQAGPGPGRPLCTTEQAVAAERPSLRTKAPCRHSRARATVATGPQPLHISRRIVNASPARLIGLQDLTPLRERTERRHSTKASTKRRKAKRHACTWVCAELHSYRAYQALVAGSMAVRVDAYCTSQACPRGGHTTPANRLAKGLLFMCQACGLALHADLIGARHGVLRTLLARQDGVSTGVLSQRLRCIARVKPKPHRGHAVRSCGGA
jgi:hypothetical protein